KHDYLKGKLHKTAGYDPFPRLDWGLAGIELFPTRITSAQTENARQRGAFDRRTYHIWRNRCVNGWLTGNASLRLLIRSWRRPRMSRVTSSIALTFTIVERWICQNTDGSSAWSNSRSGVRISASRLAVTRYVYFASAW